MTTASSTRHLERDRIEAVLTAIELLLGLSEDDAESKIGFRGNRIELSLDVAERLTKAACKTR